MEALTPWHLAIILLGFVVLFGYKKLPDASRSVGRSLRIFRSEMQSMGTVGATDRGHGDPDGEPHDATITVARLEAAAAAAEAHARDLRERARASSSGSGSESRRG